MSEALGYAVFEVGGIQQYILGTGKLKEMLGGSELIESLSKDFLEEALSKNNYVLVDANAAKCPEGGEVIALQRNAGAIHLLFSSLANARSFVQDFSLFALQSFPGLPLFAAVEPCQWDWDSISVAKGKLKKKIATKRASSQTANGMAMLPLCQAASLDGLPVILESKRDELISLPSKTRRIPALLTKARERLRSLIDLEGVPENWIDWSEDLEAMACGQGKLALVHIDGNDLGKLFRSKLQALTDKGGDTVARIKEMGKLSQLVENTTREAFSAALHDVVEFELTRKNPPKKLYIPVRPLVLGGDDVTAIVRADLALLFIDSFVRAFERISLREGQPLSAGVGMVVCPVGYPFLKAFSLAEDLIKNAKQLTAHDSGTRASSLDYIVITNDVDRNIETMRDHIACSRDNCLLTGKPFLLKGDKLSAFIQDAADVLELLPRSAVRPAMNECRKSEADGKKVWLQIEKNVLRRLGGRANSNLMSLAQFNKLFPDGFFLSRNGKKYTLLGDYLELPHMLPSPMQEYIAFFANRRSEDA